MLFCADYRMVPIMTDSSELIFAAPRCRYDRKGFIPMVTPMWLVQAETKPLMACFCVTALASSCPNAPRSSVNHAAALDEAFEEVCHEQLFEVHGRAPGLGIMFQEPNGSGKGYTAGVDR